jgi:alkylation response protein AidB-like acyl-CoA dehydrogenase
MTSESVFILAPIRGIFPKGSATMISFALDEDQQLIQETVRKFAADSLRANLREYEQNGVPERLRKQFHELGLGLLDMPEAAGGQGASLVTAAIVHEELAYGDPGAAVALWAPHLAAQAILLLGDEAQQKRFLARFAETSGHDRLGAVAYGEKSAPLEGFHTTARKNGDGWVLNGKKAWVVNGGKADLHVIFAQLDGTTGWDQVAAFVVEAGSPGLKAGPRHLLLGLETVYAGEVILEDCRVPDANRLRGGDDFLKNANRLLARAGLINAARQVGLARAAYEFALEYTQERKAFGKPVAHFQAIAFTLADMHMDVESARWLLWKAATELDKGDVTSTLEAVAHANEAAWRVSDNGVQLLGGAGFVKDYPVEKWMRDTKALALFAPPSECASLGVAAAELKHPIGTGLPSSAIQPFFT